MKRIGYPMLLTGLLGSAFATAQLRMGENAPVRQESVTGNTGGLYNPRVDAADNNRNTPLQVRQEVMNTRTDQAAPAYMSAADSRISSWRDAYSPYPSPPQNMEYAIISNTGKSLAEIQAAQPNAYASASGTAYINPGIGIVAPYYSRQNRRYFYYCTSEETRLKRDTICFDPRAGLYGNVFQEGDIYPLSCCGMANAWLAVSVANYYKQNDILLQSDETSKHANSAQYFSFDGVMLYGTDTIPGIITITHNTVSLEHIATYKGRKYYSSSLSDPQLKGIVLYKGAKTLQLARLAPTDKHLYRVVHHGKLNLYDRSYSFLTASNVGRQIIAEREGSHIKLKSDKDLIEAVNSCYNTTLPQSMSKPEVIRTLTGME